LVAPENLAKGLTIVN
jgi:hypothetical protein